MAAGEFRFSRTQLPDGYAKVNRRIALGTPAQVQTIQRAFLLLAQPDAKVRSVGAYVESTKAFEPRRRRNRDVDNSGPLGADSADALVRRLIQYVDAYHSATWVVRRRPALPLVVARDEDGDVENGSREEFWFPLPIPMVGGHPLRPCQGTSELGVGIPRRESPGDEQPRHAREISPADWIRVAFRRPGDCSSDRSGFPQAVSTAAAASYIRRGERRRRQQQLVGLHASRLGPAHHGGSGGVSPSSPRTCTSPSPTPSEQWIPS